LLKERSLWWRKYVTAMGVDEHVQGGGGAKEEVEAGGCYLGYERRVDCAMWRG